LNIQSTNTGLDLPFRAKSMPYNPLAAILQLFICKTGDKCISFGFQRFRRAPSRASSVSGSTIVSDWRNGRLGVSFFIGVLLLVRFWLDLTPATIRRLSNHAITQIPA
jgi:hypothetical protein